MNNAGVGLGGGLLHTTLDDWRWIVDINLYGVVHGCHFFVPAMVKRRRGGHVVNVASAAGYFASEALAAYATTKFAVVGLSEALRDELVPHGIGVTAVCPGIINTPITQTSRLRGPEATPEQRAYLVEAYRRRNYGPERVAENVLKAIQRNRAVAPISPEAWGMYLVKRFAPGLAARLGRSMAERTRREVERRRARAS
jgi:NAD(P)-dependent dehydrogenase (short-subunit alcohol dehydrogenase family)